MRYKDYFDKSEKDDIDDYKKSFTFRPVFSSLLPLNLKLLKIFDEPSCESNLEESKHNPDLKCKNWKLSYFIGYVKHHYIAFIRQDHIWYVCEDLVTEYVGKIDDLLLISKLNNYFYLNTPKI